MKVDLASSSGKRSLQLSLERALLRSGQDQSATRRGGTHAPEGVPPVGRVALEGDAGPRRPERGGEARHGDLQREAGLGRERAGRRLPRPLLVLRVVLGAALLLALRGRAREPLLGHLETGGLAYRVDLVAWAQRRGLGRR